MADRESPIFTEEEWARLAGSLGLSPRQTDVVKCLFRGFADKQTARRLGISVSTIRPHMKTLFMKLNVEDRIELILRVMSRFLDESRDNPCPRMQGRRQ